MVATGVHILISLALVVLLFRSERPEPYLVTALAAAVPDIDTFVFRPLIELGYLEGGAVDASGIDPLAAGWDRFHHPPRRVWPPGGPPPSDLARTSSSIP